MQAQKNKDYIETIKQQLKYGKEITSGV